MHLNDQQLLKWMVESGMGISSSIHIHHQNRDAIIAYRHKVPIIDLGQTLENWRIFLALFHKIQSESGNIGFMMDKLSIARYGNWIESNGNWTLLSSQWKPGTFTNPKKNMNLDLILFFQLANLDQQSAALEAKKLSIPSAGFISSDINPNLVDYSFLANTESFGSLDLFLQMLLHVKKN